MAVMMVTGNTALVPDPLWNVFDMVRTITATLALEMPNVVIGSTHYSALFFLALILMLMVLLINLAAKMIVERSRKKFMENSPEKTWFSKLVPNNIKLLITKYSSFIKRTCSWLLLLTISYMIASLFLTPVYAIFIAFGIVIVIEGGKQLSKKLKSVSRERIAHLSCAAAMALIISILVVLLGNIIIKGLPAISMEFLTAFPANAGLDGGIYPAIIGTLKLIIGTSVIAFPLGIISGIYLAEYAQHTRYAKIIKNAIDILNGTPSVVFGLFGMSALVVYLGIGYSLIGGCITLAFLVLPVIIKTTEEAVLAVPAEIREASLAMGVSKWETTIKVVLPAAFGGVLTGLILSLGRAAGETAPIMFTAAVAFQRALGNSLLDPIMALPYHLYYLAAEVPGSTDMQYGTALVLLAIVLSMFLLASVIRHFYAKKVKW